MLLLLKLILVPALIAAVTLAGRRWGPGVSGLLVGLPWTSGPVLFFLALERDVYFAAEAAVGIVGGVLSLGAFCLAYAWAAKRLPWAGCIGLGSITYFGATVCLVSASFSMAVTFASVTTMLALAISAMPHLAGAARPARPTRWDIPVRMVCATLVVVVLTAFAATLGPRLAGLLAPFPVYASVLAAFAHRGDGPWAAIETLRGVVRGSFSFATFFLVAAIGLEPLGIAGAFLAAGLSALSLHVALIGAHQRAPPGVVTSRSR